jgi:DNA anti-recombination protein RmuC
MISMTASPLRHHTSDAARMRTRLSDYGSLKNRRMIAMRTHTFIVACGMMLMLGVTSTAIAQDAAQPPSARQELQAIHGPHSIDQELDRLTKDLELTPKQKKRVRVLCQEHHDKIQALLDKNPTASRQALGPQIHAISDTTHHEIHALLNNHQKKLEKQMQQREHNGEENRRPAPPTSVTV